MSESDNKKTDLPNFRFEVALSFPGEHRRFVRKVANKIAKSIGKDRVFFDEWYEAELAGKNGDLKLQQIYRNQSKLVVPFFSEYYEKQWCRIEWDAVRTMLIERRDDNAVMAIRMDMAPIPGWQSIDFHISRKKRTAEQIAGLILQKIGPTRSPQSKENQYGPKTKLISVACAFAALCFLFYVSVIHNRATISNRHDQPVSVGDLEPVFIPDDAIPLSQPPIGNEPKLFVSGFGFRLFGKGDHTTHKAFYLSESAITPEQLAKSKPSLNVTSSISPTDAEEYCNWLSSQNPDFRFRLPTYSELMFADRNLATEKEGDSTTEPLLKTGEYLEELAVVDPLTILVGSPSGKFVSIDCSRQSKDNPKVSIISDERERGSFYFRLAVDSPKDNTVCTYRNHTNRDVVLSLWSYDRAETFMDVAIPRQSTLQDRGYPGWCFCYLRFDGDPRLEMGWRYFGDTRHRSCDITVADEMAKLQILEFQTTEASK